MRTEKIRQKPTIHTKKQKYKIFQQLTFITFLIQSAIPNNLLICYEY